jgi:hypothetical protein
MEEISEVIRSVVSWIAPVTGLVLMFIARRRFRLRGTTTAVVGFGLVVVILAIRQILVPVLLDQRTYSANDLGQQLVVLGVASSIGSVLAVVALRKMIAAVALVAVGEPGESGDR